MALVFRVSLVDNLFTVSRLIRTLNMIIQNLDFTRQLEVFMRLFRWLVALGLQVA